MKSLLNALIIAATSLWSISAIADDDTLLFEKRYRLTANVDYTTNLYRVYDGPVRTNRVAIRQVGSDYCDLVIAGVNYTTEPRGYLKRAQPVGGDAVYEIAEGIIYAIEIEFRQQYWTDVSCTLKAYATAGSTDPFPGDNDELMGAIRYDGGFTTDATLSLPAMPGRLISFRLAVPSFCQDVEILEAGTVVDRRFYRAERVGEYFMVGILGGYRPQAIQVALNGPYGVTCDIPVYASFD